MNRSNAVNRLTVANINSDHRLPSEILDQNFGLNFEDEREDGVGIEFRNRHWRRMFFVPFLVQTNVLGFENFQSLKLKPKFNLWTFKFFKISSGVHSAIDRCYPMLIQLLLKVSTWSVPFETFRPLELTELWRRSAPTEMANYQPMISIASTRLNIQSNIFHGKNSNSKTNLKTFQTF